MWLIVMYLLHLDQPLGIRARSKFLVGRTEDRCFLGIAEADWRTSDYPEFSARLGSLPTPKSIHTAACFRAENDHDMPYRQVFHLVWDALLGPGISPRG